MKTVLSVLSAALAIEGTFYLLKYLWNKYVHKSSNDRTNQMLFFPDEKPTCHASYTQRHGCTSSTCRYAHDNTSFGTLMKKLYSARKSVDLCIFCMTSPEMSQALIFLHKRGVRVRVVADSGQIDSEGSKVDSLRAEGEVTGTANTAYFLCAGRAAESGAAYLPSSSSSSSLCHFQHDLAAWTLISDLV